MKTNISSPKELVYIFYRFLLNLLFSFFIKFVSGLGGCFLLNSGKAKLHIMPSFSEVALDSDDKLNEWLKFFEMNSPLVAVGTLVSNDIPVCFIDRCVNAD